MSVAQLSGTLRDRLDAAVAQLSLDSPYSVTLLVQDVVWKEGYHRIFQDYRGDISGRYLGAVAVAVRQGCDVDLDKAAQVLGEVLAAQKADGSFGPPMPGVARDHGAAWGHGRLLDGLLDAREWVPSAYRGRLCTATVRLADWLITAAPGWADWLRGNGERKFLLDPLSAVRPLVRFGSEAALDAARQLVEAYPALRLGLHMHGTLLFLRGALALARASDDRALLKRVCADADTIAARFLLPGGSPLESLSEPWDVNTEGCGIADWIMLGLELFEATGDASHWERASLATFNGLLHSQAPSGHFGCETLAESGELLVRDYAPEAWWCCTFHGIQALGAFADALVRDDTGGSLLVEAPVALSTRRGGSLSVDGDYPFSNEVRLTTTDRVSLRLRVPGTATVEAVSVNGVPRVAVIESGYLVLEELTRSAVVNVTLRQHLWFLINGTVQVPPFGNTTAQAPDFSDCSTAVFRGPLLLAASAAENDPEDLVRARVAVHDRGQRDLTVTGDSDAMLLEASGYDSFRATLWLYPLGGGPLERLSRLVRVSYRGLRFEHEAVHVLEH